jgi:hypothetical protein
MLEILTLDQRGFYSIPAIRQISAGSRNHLHQVPCCLYLKAGGLASIVDASVGS